MVDLLFITSSLMLISMHGTFFCQTIIWDQRHRAKLQFFSALQGPVSRKPRKVFRPVKLYLKTEKCIRLKLLFLYDGNFSSSLEYVNKTAL